MRKVDRPGTVFSMDSSTLGKCFPFQTLVEKYPVQPGRSPRAGVQSDPIINIGQTIDESKRDWKVLERKGNDVQIDRRDPSTPLGMTFNRSEILH